MRCITLAEALRERGADCRFICRDFTGNLFDRIRQSGFEVFSLPADDGTDIIDLPPEQRALAHGYWLGVNYVIDAAQTIAALEGYRCDWLIADHYALDHQWEAKLRPYCERIMVIDDLADRVHDCDMLLDQNFYQDRDRRYQELLPKQCKTLLGPSYLLLRPEFEKERQGLRVRDGLVKRMLVFFGGTDPKNQTRIVLAALKKMNIPRIQVDVVVGHTNPNRYSIQERCDQLPGVTYHCNVSYMAELIVNADLGIGAGGSTMWERIYLGLPTITVVCAENQVCTTEDIAKLGAVEYLGWTDLLRVDDYERVISKLIANPQRLTQISDAALAVVRNQSTSTVVDEIFNFERQDSASCYSCSL